MGMFVKQFALYFLEIHNGQPEKQNDILRKQEIDASFPEPQQ
jgi:hypothetical protein